MRVVTTNMKGHFIDDLPNSLDIRQVEIALLRFKIIAEQHLDDTNVGAVLEKMGRKTVP